MTIEMTPEQIDSLYFSLKQGRGDAWEFSEMWERIINKLENILEEDDELIHISYLLCCAYMDMARLNDLGMTLVNKLRKEEE